MKKIFLLILSVLVAYITSMLLSTVTTFILRTFLDVASSENPPTLYLTFDLAYSMFYVGVGAYVGTWLGKNKIIYIAYGSLFSIFGILSLITGMDTIHPLWYQIGIIILALPAALIGGRIKLKKKTQT